VEAASVRIIPGDTDTAPDAGPASLSRNITVVTKLVERACLAIRKQRFRDPLPITVRRACRPVKTPSWNNGLNGSNRSGGSGGFIDFIDQNALAHLGWGAAVVEVEIEPVEYVPRIRGVWLGVDGGKILAEGRARRSLKFAVVQALGWASREKIAYDEGRIPDRQIRSYDIPNPRDIPPIQIDFIWTEAALPKGIGELPYSCVPAAYVQAVSQAVDHPFTGIPLTARDIWDAEQAKRPEGVL
jgi:CO/xanthine dehydrogenase Mo-binding subunit